MNISFESGSASFQISASPDGLSFTNEDATLGFVNLIPQLATPSGAAAWNFNSAEMTGQNLSFKGTFSVAGSTIDFRVELHRLQGRAALWGKVFVKNPESASFLISELRLGLDGSKSAIFPARTAVRNLRCWHTDHVRTERFPYCKGEYPLVRTLPVEPVDLGRGEDQPYPGLALFHKDQTCGLVVAAADQDLCYQSYRIAAADDSRGGALREFFIRWEFLHLEGWGLAAGEERELDGFYLEIQHDVPAQEAFHSHTRWLSERFEMRGAKSAMLTEALHCTWNYGRFERQIESELLATAAEIAHSYPGIRYFLVDGGYMKVSGMIEQFYLDPDANVDEVKFPHGMKHFTEELRKLGLKPGVWWSPTARFNSRLFNEHPDWYLRNEKGDPYLIGEDQGFLDLSKPEVVEFVEHVLKHLFVTWGFEALKMDFWSQNFEDRHGRSGPGFNLTAVQTRTILLDLIRKYLPVDGVFYTCVAVGMGNPFIGRHADGFRSTWDIGTGIWDEQLQSCMWSLPTLFMEGRQSLLNNMDSAGINLELPGNENFFRLTWCYITMGMLETGGDLEKLPENYRNAICRLTTEIDRGHVCQCADDRALTGYPLPEVLFVDFPEGSRTRRSGVKQAVAFFNWTDKPRIISVHRARLNHSAKEKARDFWSGTFEVWEAEFCTQTLPARSARLFEILDRAETPFLSV